MHKASCRQTFVWIAAFLIFLPLSTQASTRTLVILNWADYLDPELIEHFEQQYDAKVLEVYFSSDEHRSEMLAHNNAQGYDLILSSGIDLERYVKRGWIATIDEGRLSNLQHIAPTWRQAFAKAQTHAVPYFWGTTGIVYRRDLVDKPITRWEQLFRPAPELQGRISMVSDARELVGMGLKALGYSANSRDRQQHLEVERLLLEQKPYVRSYTYVSLDESSPLVSGELIASLAYSGDALMVQEHHENLVYVLPEEGGNIWVDYFAVGSKAGSPDLAYAFLNYINQPEVAAQQAQFVYYATPNLAAERLLPAEFLQDPVIYPNSASLVSSEFYQQHPPKVLRWRNTIGAKLLQ